MNSSALTKTKKQNPTTFSPVFDKKLSGRTITPESANDSRDVSNPEFGHNFGDVQVESQSFKQSCLFAMSGPAHCPFGGACNFCPPNIQLKRANDPQETSSLPASVYKVLHSPGQSMEPDERDFFESCFCHDFGHVRIHNDSQAGKSAHELSARAYTLGSNVIFGSGQYTPETTVGRRLLAHELTHVQQQKVQHGLRQSSLHISPSGDAFERQANETADKIMNNERPGKIAKLYRPALQCDPAGPPLSAPSPITVLTPEQKKKALEFDRRNRRKKRVREGPMMRHVRGKVVRGFPVTRNMCRCEDVIKKVEDGIKERIEAYRSCSSSGIDSVADLYECAKQKVYGSENAPPSATASSGSSTVNWLSDEQWKERAKRLNLPREGPCVSLVWRGMLVHETGHIEDFAKVAAKGGAMFLVEFNRRTGDEDRMEKLKEDFPEETAKYVSEISNVNVMDPLTALRTEVNAYNKEKQFFAEVRAALKSICKPSRPSVVRRKPERSKFTRRPLYKHRMDFSSDLYESQENL